MNDTSLCYNLGRRTLVHKASTSILRPAEVGKKIRSKWDINDFLPKSQDRFTIGLISYKSKALDALKNGDFQSAYKKMAGQWRFLPGKDQQGNLSVKTVLQDTKSAISDELQGKSKLATEKGSLLKDF